jgi:NAD(P)-dependent dehydrogenase (short-subunit alcohol dehydrogenase family)
MNFVVTGASRGIGYQTVVRLAQQTGNTIVAISRNKEKIAGLADHCYQKYRNPNIIPIAFDLTDIENINKQLIPKIKEKIGTLDVLINNAGYLQNKEFAGIKHEDLMMHFTVNFFSVFELIKKALKLFHDSRVKHIVNIGTMGAVQGSKNFGGMSAYVSSKAAVAGLTETLAVELRDKNIRINYLALGAVETDMFREAFPGRQASMDPPEMAEFIADFAINGWKYFNGKILPVSTSDP